MNKKILIISMHPAPYRDRIFEKIKCELNYDIDIIYLFTTDSGHPEWNLGLPKIPPLRKIFLPLLGYVHLGLINHAKHYDVLLIPAWFPVTLLLLLVISQLRKQKIIFSCDTIIFKKDILHNIIYFFLKKCDLFFVPGFRTTRVLTEILHISPSKIFQGSYMLDNYQLYQDCKRKNKKAVRERWGIDSNLFVYLFIGKFVKTRNIPLLLQAFDHYLKNNDKMNTLLLIIGNGKYHNNELNLFTGNNIGKVKIFEKVEFNDLVDIYSIADCYVHPGKEPYSLATVQAVVSELPVIASKDVGCVDDYIKDGINGYIIADDNHLDFSKCMTLVEQGKIKKEGIKLMAAYAANNRNILFSFNELSQAISLVCEI